MTTTSSTPRFEELVETAALHGEDKTYASIALFSLFLNLGARPDYRARLVAAFFDMLNEVRPDITPDGVKKIENYILALNRDGQDYLASLKK